MSNQERTGYRDIIFSQWHRLIPHLKMIDLDFVQCCKVCSKPILLCELTSKRGASLMIDGYETRKPSKILRLLSEGLSVMGVVITYRPRLPGQGFDEIHARYLDTLWQVDDQIRKLCLERLRIIEEVNRYCYSRYGATGAYDALISEMGHWIVHPEKSEYEPKQSTLGFKNSMEKYRYCSDECQARGNMSFKNYEEDILLPPNNGDSIATLVRKYSGKTIKGISQAVMDTILRGT